MHVIRTASHAWGQGGVPVMEDGRRVLVMHSRAKLCLYVLSKHNVADFVLGD
jgi:hypothetical protein